MGAPGLEETWESNEPTHVILRLRLGIGFCTYGGGCPRYGIEIQGKHEPEPSIQQTPSNPTTLFPLPTSPERFNLDRSS